MSLVVKAAIATPGDFAPDAYILANKAGTQLYKFVPHKGLEKLSLVEARELIADHMHQAQILADKAIAKVSRRRSQRCISQMAPDGIACSRRIAD
jgi:hypothetical protein